MPSLHEAILLVFRNRPTLAPELMREALHCELPPYTDARIDSADLTAVEPAEYRADLVVLLLNGVPVHGIIVEAQLSPDPRKKFVWPVYMTSLRARLELPLSLLVVTAEESVARWAATGPRALHVLRMARRWFSTQSAGGCILIWCSSRSATQPNGS